MKLKDKKQELRLTTLMKSIKVIKKTNIRPITPPIILKNEDSNKNCINIK